MRKAILMMAAVSIVLSSCDTYQGQSAYAGSMLGSILGSAIGGLTDGPRGSDIGTIVGMAAGAVVGSAIADAAAANHAEAVYKREQARKERIRERRERERKQEYEQGSSYGTINPGDNYGGYGSTNQGDNYGSGYGSTNQGGNYDSGFDSTNQGDDRIYDFTSKDYTGNMTTQEPTASLPKQSSIENMVDDYVYTPSAEIRNARFIDDSQDGILQRGEMAKLIFEVVNSGKKPLIDVVPTVVESRGMKQIYISPNMHVEVFQPGRGIRYTAIIKAGNRLKPGVATFCASVVVGGKAISKVTEFNIPTKK